MAREWRERAPGRGLRYALIASSVAAGLLLALATLPYTDGWRDQALHQQLDVN